MSENGIETDSEKIAVLFCLVGLILYIPVNMGQVFLGWTSTKQQKK